LFVKVHPVVSAIGDKQQLVSGVEQAVSDASPQPRPVGGPLDHFIQFSLLPISHYLTQVFATTLHGTTTDDVVGGEVPEEEGEPLFGEPWVSFRYTTEQARLLERFHEAHPDDGIDTVAVGLAVGTDDSVGGGLKHSVMAPVVVSLTGMRDAASRHASRTVIGALPVINAPAGASVTGASLQFFNFAKERARQDALGELLRQIREAGQDGVIVGVALPDGGTKQVRLLPFVHYFCVDWKEAAGLCGSPKSPMAAFPCGQCSVSHEDLDCTGFAEDGDFIADTFGHREAKGPGWTVLAAAAAAHRVFSEDSLLAAHQAFKKEKLALKPFGLVPTVSAAMQLYEPTAVHRIAVTEALHLMWEGMHRHFIKRLIRTIHQSYASNLHNRRGLLMSVLVQRLAAIPRFSDGVGRFVSCGTTPLSRARRTGRETASTLCVLGLGVLGDGTVIPDADKERAVIEGLVTYVRFADGLMRDCPRSMEELRTIGAGANAAVTAFRRAFGVHLMPEGALAGGGGAAAEGMQDDVVDEAVGGGVGEPAGVAADDMKRISNIIKLHNLLHLLGDYVMCGYFKERSTSGSELLHGPFKLLHKKYAHLGERATHAVVRALMQRRRQIAVSAATRDPDDASAPLSWEAKYRNKHADGAVRVVVDVERDGGFNGTSVAGAAVPDADVPKRLLRGDVLLPGVDDEGRATPARVKLALREDRHGAGAPSSRLPGLLRGDEAAAAAVRSHAIVKDSGARMFRRRVLEAGGVAQCIQDAWLVATDGSEEQVVTWLAQVLFADEDQQCVRYFNGVTAYQTDPEGVALWSAYNREEHRGGPVHNFVSYMNGEAQCVGRFEVGARLRPRRRLAHLCIGAGAEDVREAVGAPIQLLVIRALVPFILPTLGAHVGRERLMRRPTQVEAAAAPADGAPRLLGPPAAEELYLCSDNPLLELVTPNRIVQGDRGLWAIETQTLVRLEFVIPVRVPVDVPAGGGAAAGAGAGDAAAARLEMPLRAHQDLVLHMHGGVCDHDE